MLPSLVTLVDAHAIVLLQDEHTRLWHETAPESMSFPEQISLPESPSRESPRELNPERLVASFQNRVILQHHANFTLWHAEDEARHPQSADATIAGIKQQIDRWNQQRNDTTEQIDACLLALVEQTLAYQGGEQHSETPGMIVDRLSILSLKLFHTREEIRRHDAPEGHGERNVKRFAVLDEQRTDLTKCLDRLWSQICVGERYFKQYRQLKMYNDPELNPVLYRTKMRDKAT